MTYDIFYEPDSRGNVPFDRDVPLPEPPPKGAVYAHNTNGDGAYLVPHNDGWRRVSKAYVTGWAKVAGVL